MSRIGADKIEPVSFGKSVDPTVTSKLGFIVI
jgi:hypothetical protein